MIVVKLFIFMLLISLHQCRLPDKVYCANAECSQPISKAKTTLKYNSGDADLMSVPANAEAMVYMKSAGTHPDLWYVTIDGKSGFISKTFLKEIKVFVKKLEHILPFQMKPEQPNVQPDKVQQAHEVVDGTTIYTSDPSVDSQTVPQNSDTSPESTSALPVQEPSQDLINNDSDDKAEIENVNSQISSKTPLTEQTTKHLNTEPLLEVTSPSTVDTTVLIDNIIETVTVNNNNEEVSLSVESQVDVISNDEVVESITTTYAGVDTSTDVLPQIVTSDSSIENTIQSELPVEKPDTLLSPQALSAASGDTLTPDTVKISENIGLLNSLQSTEDEANEQNISMNNENSQLPPIDKSEVNEINNLEQPEQAALHDNGVLNPDNNNKNNVNGNIDLAPETIVVTEPETTIVNVVASTESVDATTPNIPANLEFETPTIENFISASTESVEATTPTIPATLDTETPTTENYIFSPTESIETTPQTTPETLYSEPPTTENVISASTGSIETTTQTIPAILVTDHPTTENVILASTENIETIAENTSTETYNYMTTEAPLEEDILSYTTPSTDDTYSTNSESSDISTSEKPDSEDNGGFFSNMYTTISDMWPSTTEAPLIDNVFSENNGAPQIESNSEGGFSFLSYLWSTYHNVMGTEDEVKALFPSAGETCFTDEYCDGVGSPPNNRLLTFLLTAAGSILLFILGYYYIDSKKQDSKFIADINALQRDLMFTSKECELLKEDLATTKNKLAGIEDSSFGKDDMVQSLKEEINELKAQNERLRLSLDDNEKLLRVSENTAGELQNTLSEVENTLSELFGERANSEDQIADLNGKIEAFEEELIVVTRDRDNFQLKYVSAESALEESKKQKIQLEDLTVKLNEANNTIELQKHEIVALKDALKELKNGLKSDVNVDSLIDHTEIKAKLSKALEEKILFEKKFEIEYKERSRLTEELTKVQESLRTTNQQATESSTRLDVLGKYFQERESELLKELSAKESLFLSKQGESASTVEKMELLQKEIQRFKEKCDALTFELAEQESAKRSAISEIESRAHHAWLECRAARREADAARDEAATLRRRLAKLGAADGASSPHTLPPPLDAEVSLLPPLFLPPLLPPLPRPPPLGRLPSPLPQRYGDRRYSPDSRYSPERRYSPESRYSPDTARPYSPDSRYSPRSRRSPYSSPRSRPRRSSRERYDNGRGSRSRNGPVVADTETEYNSDSPSREPRRRPRYSRHSGPSSGSGCSSESDK